MSKVSREEGVRIKIAQAMSGLKSRAFYQEIPFAEESEAGANLFLDLLPVKQAPHVSLLSDGTYCFRWRTDAQHFVLNFIDHRRAHYTIVGSHSDYSEIELLPEVVDSYRLEKLLGF